MGGTQTEFLVKIFLPVIWALVATGIALALYKTSAALFDGTEGGTTSTKRLRLAGSVVIAALAFLGLKMSTPRSNLTQVPSDSVIVRKALLNDIKTQGGYSHNAAQDVSACVDIAEPADCKGPVLRLKDRVDELQRAVARLPNTEE